MGGYRTMNTINRVRITINGVHYTISTSEPEEYVLGLAQELDEQIKGILEKNPSISFNDVMVLCAINYIDAYKRSEENADRMRTQISEYLEDAAKARIELDEVKRENAHLRRQLDGQEMKGQTKLDVK
ncbi:cell division protein ZapA [Anaerotruncus massiliensis (ex Liu et al. 2021)]|uniref:Cell division protein ZapA n=3 Tax=Anaerotruncus TaxID=244127 RepID=A0A498CL94_9FIRM|nr:cell division protein ZapA [Anaerotruncus massiliensis (ex Liu et al. 2021)]